MLKQALFTVTTLALALNLTACSGQEGSRANMRNDLRGKKLIGQKKKLDPNQVGKAVEGCNANIEKITVVLQKEKFTKESESVLVVTPSDLVSARTTAEIKSLKGEVFSSAQSDDSLPTIKETYDLKKLEITSEKGKIAFQKEEALYKVNEADLTVQIYGDVYEDSLNLAQEGDQKLCSFVAQGEFSINEKDGLIESKIVLKETYELDAAGLASLQPVSEETAE